MANREVDQIFANPSRVAVEVQTPGVGLQPQRVRELPLGKQAERPWPARLPVLPRRGPALDRGQDGEVEREAAGAGARLEIHEGDKWRSTASPRADRPGQERLL